MVHQNPANHSHADVLHREAPSPDARFAATIQQINDVESRHDLLQYTIDGWCVWPLLRSTIRSRMDTLNVKINAPDPAEKRILALRDLRALPTLPRARYMIVTDSSGLAEQEHGKYKDIWFDDLMLKLDDCFKLEVIDNRAFLAQRHRALIPATLTTTLFDGTRTYLAQRRIGPRVIEEIAQHFYRIVQQEFDIDLSRNWIRRRLYSFYWLKKWYSLLLWRVRPSAVLVRNAFRPEAIAAARERGIDTVELQHGLINRYQIMYAWSPYAVPYRATLPIADRLMLYGAYWKDELLTTGFWGDDLRVVGSPRLDSYRQRREQAADPDVCTLLLTSQGVDTERVLGFLRAFLDLAREQANVHLIVKMHPRFELHRDPYTAAFGDDQRVTILAGNEEPSTFTLLTRASLHLSIYSSCHYEALGLGVPTVILPFERHEMVRHLHEAGHAALVHTPHDLLDLARRWREQEVPDAVRNYYFQEDALNNIAGELGHNTEAP